MPLKLFTFCVDIGKHSQKDLKTSLNILLKSIKKYVKDYQVICYSNFINSEEYSEFNIEFRKYYDNTINLMYSDNWLNLSFNKINIYKDLREEFSSDFIWIDIDTVVLYDISYLNDVSNFFVPIGGSCTNKNFLFSNNQSITVPRKDYIQGHFWKLNPKLYDDLIETLNEINIKGLKLRFDLQDLFGYYLYYKNFYNTLNVFGKNYKLNVSNSLSVWSKTGNTHASLDGLQNLFFDGKILRSKYEIENEIHILSFTMETMKRLIHTNEFNKLFGDFL